MIDADLGLSGASATPRSGFNQLVGRGRPQRGRTDPVDRRDALGTQLFGLGTPLLDICGLRWLPLSPIATAYMIRSSANGRLLLGLKGTISELELHTIRSRLTAGLLAKAERGELAPHLADRLGSGSKRRGCQGSRHGCSGTVGAGVRDVLQVRHRSQGHAHALNGRGLDLPRRDRTRRFALDASDDLISGGNPGKSGLCRGLSFMAGLLHTGDYSRSCASRGRRRRVLSREWRIVVKDRYPAKAFYIDWQTYERIRAAIRATTEPNTCAPKPEARRATVIFYCTVSPGVGAMRGTRCTSGLQGWWRICV